MGSKHDIWIDCSSPPTIQPRSCFLRFLPLWSRKRCRLWEEV